eukprot:3990816-Prymnesium_polylepis.1
MGAHVIENAKFAQPPPPLGLNRVCVPRGHPARARSGGARVRCSAHGRSATPAAAAAGVDAA